MTDAHPQTYLRPVPCAPGRPGARPLAGGPLAFAEIAVHRRGAPIEVLPADAVQAMFPDEAETLQNLSAPRAAICGVAMDRPRLMGVVNITPDSFSDGGFLRDAYAAVDHALALAEAGADILDIGGESTRPGAQPVPEAQERERVLPVIEGILAAGCKVPISIDTRNAGVAKAALAAGAQLFNDVSALTHDLASAEVAKDAGAVCLMHAQGDPRTMQKDPSYEDVLLDVYDYLAARLAAAARAGIPREKLIVDPGIGFGKTIAHNLALIRGMSMFQGLGCAVLLGVSRKGFIGKLSGEGEATRRAPGSIAAGLAGCGAGVQILRVHDVAEHAQALAVWRAIEEERA